MLSDEIISKININNFVVQNYAVTLIEKTVFCEINQIRYYIKKISSFRAN